MARPSSKPDYICALQNYLEEHLDGFNGPISLKQFGFGASNPTYLLSSGNGQQYVLRGRPPGVTLSPTAHRIDREYRVLCVLQGSDVPAPKPYLFCDDKAVMGTTFYVMEYLEGRIFEEPSLQGVSERDRTEMWRSVVAALAKLHRFDYTRAGLASLGKSSGFFTRQVSTFANLAASQGKAVDPDTGVAIGNIPHFEEMSNWFAVSSNHPTDRASLIHGDYKIDNVVFHKTEPRVIGILDWEMATIGHPLSDFSNLTQPYVTAAYHRYVGFNKDCPLFVPGRLAGLPAREQVLAEYCELTGVSYTREDVDFADAFGAFRLSIVLQGIAARDVLGQSSSPRAKEYASQRFANSEWAYDLVCRLRGEGTSTQMNSRVALESKL